jgi:branched-chain amino acid transport system permease protein
VGHALIFGVANVINPAHGSVYAIDDYVVWAAITFLHTPLVVTFLIVAFACGALGALIERVGLRPLQGRALIAPLLALPKSALASCRTGRLARWIVSSQPSAWRAPGC